MTASTCIVTLYFKERKEEGGRGRGGGGEVEAVRT